MAKLNKRRSKPLNQRLSFWIMITLVMGVAFFGALALIATPFRNFQEPVDHTKEEFIERLAPYAQTIQQREGVLPSIILGQAILESDWGQSGLSQSYNNLFGVKAGPGEPSVDLATKEFVDGKWFDINAPFKVYQDWEASMDDHAKLFKNGVTWNTEIYKGVLAAKNYKEAAHQLQLAGYATDPDYQNKIINVIEAYELYQYD
ncbi:glycoside hydrolase family 73 protein [Vagococcus sp. PNs007]|uniref:Glycoside hydrolase family 73 protein n=1 Tax=Vagococcus proximus TaxID=2991417 RepID=A0ABT5X0M0_9ENTE|nr:glycoside hydrolase family 73 protein [Vagococcus proximus]MDF0479457.1 glycoside hydrolase family 73 protein [Vagococcus proximus]